MKDDCPFCDYAGPSEVIMDWDDAFLIKPLAAVTPGHLLVVAKEHVHDFAHAPEVTAAVFQRAAEYVKGGGIGWDAEANLITSMGREATQTVFHLHVHILPRTAGDGVRLPWANPNMGERSISNPTKEDTTDGKRS